ncbi:hypothetical protein LINPERPRIM_LOCUS28171 [Linum perenne]
MSQGEIEHPETNSEVKELRREDVSEQFCFSNDEDFEGYLLLRNYEMVHHGYLDTDSLKEEVQLVETFLKHTKLWGFFKINNLCLADALR